MSETIKPDKFQLDIIKEYKKGVNILVNSGAGSGKTSLIKMLVNKTPANKKIILNSFNKHIVEELKERINHPKAHISTIHSLAYTCIKQVFGVVDISENKYVDFLFKRKKKIVDIIKPETKKDLYRAIYRVADFVNYYYTYYCSDVNDLKINLAKNSILISDTESFLVKKIISHFKKINETPYSITFPEMIYLPTFYDYYPVPKCDVLIVDEAQDISKLQLAFIKKIITGNEHCQYVFVGDNYQSIYQFNGADSNSFDNIKDIGNIKEMPLSFCYRCGDEIIDHGNEIRNKLIKPDNVKKGKVVKKGDINLIRKGDMVLCRNNAPLIDVYFYLIKNKITSYIRGRDLSSGLISLINRYGKKGDLGLLIDNLKEYLDDEINIILKEGKNPYYSEKLEKLGDKIKSIEIISENCKNVDELKKQVKFIFKEKKNGAILCTIHASKGLENERVFFYKPSLLPSKYATTEEQIEQETNLCYVARTRAVKELIYIA